MLTSASSDSFYSQ